MGEDSTFGPPQLAMKVRGKKVFLIHHWDADGIASAAILINEFHRMEVGEIVNIVPNLGEFELTREWLENAKRDPPDILVTADICIPLDNLIQLRNELGVEIVMFDHHSRARVREEGIYFVNYVSLWDEDWPSNTLVLNHFFDLGPSILASFGLVGDKGDGILRYQAIWPDFNRHIESLGLNIGQIKNMVDLLDSCYKAGHRDAVMTWAKMLSSKTDREMVELIQNDVHLNTFVADIESKVEGLFDKGLIDYHGIQLSSITTKYHIISALTRKFSITYPEGEVMVVNDGIFPTRTQLYLRSRRYDLRPLIGKVQKMGQSAGGKIDVVGAVIDNDFLEDIMLMLAREVAGLSRGGVES